LLLLIISTIAGTIIRHAASSIDQHVNLVVSLLLVAFLIWSWVAIAAQRFHDLGASGWWALLSLIPFVSLIILLLLIFAPGQKQANCYGAMPCPGSVTPSMVLE
jgi:uncharacterized membrane protein YhaH (DUF805 family)